MLDNEFTRKRSIPDEYARCEGGCASVFYEHLCEPYKPENYLEGTPFRKEPSTSELLEAIAIYWFGEAATHFSNQNTEECFTFLHESYQARALNDYDNTFYMLEETHKEERSLMARRAAEDRLKRDPKQKEKRFINSCWQEWQNNPTRYSGKAAFARDMLDKCEHLVSGKKIEDWCREWEKRNAAS